MEKTTQWLLEWFAKKGPLQGRGLKEKLKLKYFKAGIIDSLGVIEMITAVEKQFRIRFNQNDFQDPRFQTIGGLCDMILDLRKPAGRKKRG